MVLFIVSNKCDMEEERVVSKERALDFASRNNAIFMETSAKENIGVEELFKRVTDEVCYGITYLICFQLHF